MRRSQSLWGTPVPLEESILLEPLCKTHFISQTHPLVRGIQKAFSIDLTAVETSPPPKDTPFEIQYENVYDLCFKVDNEITRQFREIRFVHWALYSIGLRTQNITNFQQHVKNLCNHLRGVVSQTGIQRDKLDLKVRLSLMSGEL